MKLAVCFAPARADTENVVAAMAESMCLADNQQCKTLPIVGGALACVTTSDISSSISVFRQGSKGNILALAGVPIKLEGSLDACLARAVAGGYEQATEQLTCLDGAFAALFWDAAARKLVVITDPLGLQPLYIARPDGGLLIASELKAFPASGLMETKMDPAGWGAFLSLDFNIGEHTQLAGVSRIKAANILSYCAKTGKLEDKCYWSWPEPYPRLTLEDIDIGQLLDVTRQEIRSYIEHSRFSTSLLSGGFDSRLIMSLVHQEGLDCAALTLQHQEELFGTDGRLAVQVAKKLNHGKYELVTPSRRYYESPAFLRYLVMSEVAVPCLNLFITQVSQYLRPEMKAVWDGLGPNFAFAPAHGQLGTFEDYLKVRCRPTTSLHWEAAGSIFSKEVGQAMKEDFVKLLGEETARYPNDEFGVTRFQVNNRMRRCISLDPTKVYANYVLPFIPCVSRKFWNLAAKIPRTVTDHKQLHIKLFKEHFPEAMRVPFCSGGSLYSPHTFTPRLWALATTSMLHKRGMYYWHRLGRLPVAGRLLLRLGAGANRRGEANRLVEQIVQIINPEHEDLNSDAVMAIRRMRPPYDWKTRIARNLLFYWQVWRWVMEAQLTTWNAETFLQQESEQKNRSD